MLYPYASHSGVCGFGQVTDGVYRFTMTNAVALVADPGMLRDGLQQRQVLHAGLLARPHRHDAVQHLAPAAQVVIGHPARQPV